MNDKIENKELIFIFFIILLSITFRLFFINVPLDRDEGAYAYIADRMEKRELPYKNIFDHKQPMVYHIYRLSLDFLGKSYQSIRIFTTIYLILTFLLFYSLIRIFYNKWISLLSLFLFVLHINNHNFQGLNSNAEVFLFLPVFISLIFLLNSDENFFKSELFLTGIFLGIAFFIKMISILILFPIIFYIIKFFKKNKLQKIVWLLSGFLFLFFIIVLWAIKNNMLKEFIECNFLYNLYYINRFNFKNVPLILIKGGGIFIKLNFILFLGFLFGLYKILSDKKKPFIYIFFMIVFFFYLSIVMLSGIYPHYYLVLIPFLSLLSALFLFEMFFILRKYFKKVVLLFSGFIILYLVYYIKINDLYNYYFKTNYKIMEIFYETKAISDIINLNKNTNSSVFVYANEPEIYFYTEIKSPSKYIYNYPGKLKLTDFLTDFLVIEKNNIDDNCELYLKKNYKKFVEFKNLVLYTKRR